MILLLRPSTQRSHSLFGTERKNPTSANLDGWKFTTSTIQVAEMLRATAEQQLASTNLQPTNLLFNHNTLNSETTMTENGLEQPCIKNAGQACYTVRCTLNTCSAVNSSRAEVSAVRNNKHRNMLNQAGLIDRSLRSTPCAFMSTHVETECAVDWGCEEQQKLAGLVTSWQSLTRERLLKLCPPAEHHQSWRNRTKIVYLNCCLHQNKTGKRMRKHQQMWSMTAVFV